MNILVTGANGQLGREIRNVAKEKTNHKWFFTDIVEDENTHKLDITIIGDVRRYVRDNNVNLIVNCAAYCNIFIDFLEKK